METTKRNREDKVDKEKLAGEIVNRHDKFMRGELEEIFTDTMPAVYWDDDEYSCDPDDLVDEELENAITIKMYEAAAAYIAEQLKILKGE